jgi:hypothetical protein
MARRGDGIYLDGRTWWLDFMHDGRRNPQATVSFPGIQTHGAAWRAAGQRRPDLSLTYTDARDRRPWGPSL